VLLVEPRHLWLPGTKFCPRNASAGGGRDVREGKEAFEALFAPSVRGAYGKTFERQLHRPPFLTTDEQAEVLIRDRVERQDILGIAVRDESQAKREITRLRMLNERVPQVTIAPDFFAPNSQSAAFQVGRLPKEHLYFAGDENG
jgi:hypothetical protein